MGELIQFPGIKKEEKKEVETKNKIVMESNYSNLEERTAINILSRDRFDTMLNLKMLNPISRSSDTYVRAYELLKKSSKVDIAEMVNNASEMQIKMKPSYFIAAFNILCE